LRNVFSAQVVAGAGGGVPPQLDHVVGWLYVVHVYKILPL
jgi:hypothetical protein